MLLVSTLGIDTIFRLSLLRDIALGLTTLHASAVKSHGRLSSSSVLIDRRFRCQLADYGAPSLREPLVDGRSSDQLLWTAPELLRLGKAAPLLGTRKGDVRTCLVF